MHKISNASGIARAMGLQSGDVLLSINGKTIQDVLDYRFSIFGETHVLLEVEKDNEIWELEIEKEADEDIGLVFGRPLMDKPRRCQNRCLFCFIDQNPPGLRESLYFKDDDPRLSFLMGNYVTLTNLSDAEAARIAGFHLSPLHISVHAACPDVRRRMLGNPKAGDLFGHLRRFRAAGITLHFQIVLCKGINDGKILDDTIRALLELHEADDLAGASLSVVPVGLTKHRQNLYPLQPFGRKEAEKVLNQLSAWQKHCLSQYGTRFVFASDEWYLKAGRPIPNYAHYEDFPQLENGVGMWRLFHDGFMDALQAYKKKPLLKEPIGIVTGLAEAGLMTRLAKATSSNITIYPIQNHFWGPEITVSGLLTGQDIVGQLRGALPADLKTLFLPENLLRCDTDILLDDMTVRDIARALGVEIKVGAADGGRFAGQVLALAH